MKTHNHNHNHSHPEGSGGHKPLKVNFTDFKMEKAFAFNPAKGEKGIINYTLPTPARVSIKVVKKGTRELYLKTILNWEFRDAGTHTESWDGMDYKRDMIDLATAIIVIEGEPMSTYAPGQYSVDGLSDEDIVHGHSHGHSHNTYRESANVTPKFNVTSVKEGDVLSGLVTIESFVNNDERGYGDEVGFGVRYYLDNMLVQEEFYDEKSNGMFSYTMDTTSYPDGEYTLYVGMCDHHQHVTSRGYRIMIKNVLPSAGDAF